ncbi:MAG TPA: hypothetical protein VMW27_02500 [Thermoanaerobaculia bacterium]|nr:hypothetical protein [Thermoanaerobaculia bacterium]
MKSFVAILALSLTPAVLYAGDSTSQKAVPVVVEAHPSQQKFVALAQKNRVSLPQLRIYDRTGRLRHDFNFSFVPDSFNEQLDAILRSPLAPTTLPVTLPGEFDGLLDSSERPLTAPPEADLVMVEYWATWCQPCHAQNKALLAQLQKWPALKVVLLHVSLDKFTGG